ncbi:MAG: copper resistance-related lipoprotein [Candidatus Poribacteria bacterium]|nr:MAG: copper resistance-related lipoprotein [Candidatus Poribacteria bacterium]
MRRVHGSLWIGLTAALFLGGCAGAIQEGAFRSVERTVQERSGLLVERLAFGSEAEERVARSVQELLEAPLTEENAVRIALLNNRELQAAYEELGVVAADWLDAGLVENPVLRGSAGFPTAEEDSGSDGTGPDLLAEVEWNVLSLFTRSLRRGSVGPKVAAAQARVAAAVLETVRRVRRAYAEVQAAEARVELFQQATAAAEAAELLAQRLREAGNIPEFDRLAQISFAQQMRISLEQAIAARDAARERLNALLGLWGPQTGWTLSGERLSDPPETLELPENLEAEAVRRSLELAALRQEIEAEAKRLGLLNATRWVQDLELSVETERQDGEWEAGPGLRLPLPLFDRKQGQRAAAEARLRQLAHRYTAQAVAVRAAARTAQRRLIAAHRIAQYYRSSVLPLHERLVERALLRYNAMQIGVFQLLAAKQAQVQAADRYTEALREYWQAWYDLQALQSGTTLELVSSPLPAAMEATPSAEGGH